MKRQSVLDALCSSVGSLTNTHKLVKTLDSQGHVRTTDRTMKRYLGYFEDAFLFSKADRYDVRGKRYLEYPKKIETRSATVCLRRFVPAWDGACERYVKE